MRKLIDIEKQRSKLKKLESKNTRMAEVWRSIQRFAREKPVENPWLLPFVAVIDENPDDILNAKKAIDNYLSNAEQKGDRGYLFNIWCFAFPLCRWVIWFDMMRQAGFYTKEEADEISAKFLMIQFRDNHSGLLIKPFPQCVDNQAASLVLASYVVGSIFAEDGPGNRNIARKMRDEAAPRIEAMIGGMPNSGYSGEGSTYQGLIVAFAIPFLTEVLEDIRGEKVFETPLWPNNTSPKNILQMTKRLWMPGGMLLPWDDYGYQFGIRFPLAYLAYRTGDNQCMQMLEYSANWSRTNIVSSGWGFDEPIWTLIFWPEYDHIENNVVWDSWAEDELGAVLVDPKGENYLMQMWDPTDHMCTRAHVNPNSLILVHKGIPFSADGTVMENCSDLNYDGAIFERSFGAGAKQVMNLSKGCGGSHNCILIDCDEGLRPAYNFEQGRMVSFDKDNKTIVGDVTGLYQSVYEDCKKVVRRSHLSDNRFWIVEDFAKFDNKHEFTSRWWFRPGAAVVDGGVDVLTPEGALLQQRCVLGSDKAVVKRVDGFPKEPDACSDKVSYLQSGKEARWLYVLWPAETIETKQVLKEWKAFPVEADLDFETISAFEGQTFNIHPGLPPWFQQNLPISSYWAYDIDLKMDSDKYFLKVPRGIDPHSRLWINGIRHNMESKSADKLIGILIDCEKYMENSDTLRITLLLTLAIGHTEKGNYLSFPDQPFELCAKKLNPERLKSCEYVNGVLSVETTHDNKYISEYRLLEDIN